MTAAMPTSRADVSLGHAFQWFRFRGDPERRAKAEGRVVQRTQMCRQSQLQEPADNADAAGGHNTGQNLAALNSRALGEPAIPDTRDKDHPSEQRIGSRSIDDDIESRTAAGQSIDRSQDGILNTRRNKSRSSEHGQCTRQPSRSAGRHCRAVRQFGNGIERFTEEGMIGA